jgi:tRNA(Ile)-lysidine synthase TilS/MesJ
MQERGRLLPVIFRPAPVRPEYDWKKTASFLHLSHHWMCPGDHIAVVISGDRKSTALLYFLKKLTADRRDIRLIAVPSSDRDTGTGDRSAAIKVAEALRIPCIEMPLPGDSGNVVHEEVTRMAMAISVDDIAGDVLGQFLFGSADRLVHPHPDGGAAIPLICPFITIPSDELDLYWDSEGMGINLLPGMSDRDTLTRETVSILEDYSRRHPATKYALLHLAEELNGRVAEGIAAAALGRNGPGPEGTYRGGA